MADFTEISTRIKQKIDDLSNWISCDPVLLDGELAVVGVPGGNSRFKVGDGTRRFNQLPYADSKVTLISGDAAYSSDLSVVKLTNAEYNELVSLSAVNTSAVYIINDTYTSMRGQQIKDLSAPTDDNDAATKKYVDDHGVELDDEVTQSSANGVKSSGIWTFVKGLLPSWLNKDYAEPATVASVNFKADKSTTYTKTEVDSAISGKLDKSGGLMTGALSVLGSDIGETVVFDGMHVFLDVPDSTRSSFDFPVGKIGTIAITSDIPSLAGQSYNLSVEGDFAKMCIAVAKALGADVTEIQT